MSIVWLLLTAVGLSMDACAVAAANALSVRKVTLLAAAGMTATFGGMQGAMALAGHLLGATFADAVVVWAPWIAGLVLVGLGGKMLYEAAQREPDDGHNGQALWPDMRETLALGVATSLDAAAAGVSLGVLEVDVPTAVATITTVTAALVATAIAVGRRAGAWLGPAAERLGGAVLVGLGLKLIVERLLS